MSNRQSTGKSVWSRKAANKDGYFSFQNENGCRQSREENGIQGESQPQPMGKCGRIMNNKKENEEKGKKNHNKTKKLKERGTMEMLKTSYSL